MSWLSVSSDSVPSVLSEVAVEVSGSGDMVHCKDPGSVGRLWCFG